MRAPTPHSTDPLAAPLETAIRPAAPAAQEEVERRFGGVLRLYGAPSVARFAAARVAIIGLGGVGSWAAEALARSGVPRLTLVDLDHIAPSNANRQIHALDDAWGMAKVQAMAQRIAAIHPGAQVRAVEDYATAGNVGALLDDQDLIIDCIDQAAVKAALVAEACRRRLPVVVCGGAGGRKDPTRIRCVDLARTQGDALLARVRQLLRRDHGFAPHRGGSRPAVPFGVLAVCSDEPMLAAPLCASGQAPGSPLACAGYGSAVTVTATMGMVAAACALRALDAPA